MDELGYPNLISIRREIEKHTIVGFGGLLEKCLPSPRAITSDAWQKYCERLQTIHCFLQIVLDIFLDATKGSRTPALRHLLLGDIESGCQIALHEKLPNELWHIPRFFRTDESASGKILEIQAPGSGWGDLQLLRDVYCDQSNTPVLTAFQPSQCVAQQIRAITGKDNPSVLHLLDNASNPASMRYLIATSQPPLRYWGYEPTVEIANCDFIRSHSFAGLISENLFWTRIKGAQTGAVHFDLPPLAVFDQKMPLCLPFFDATRDRFGDDVRELFPYSYPLSSNGFRDFDGKWVSIDDFCDRPPARRRYFLKYAGCDTTINWGSRGVFRLNKAGIKSQLRNAAIDAMRGKHWLIQVEESEKEDVSYCDTFTSAPASARLTSKYSCFYGPTDLIGIKLMFRQHFKVHGQPETISGIALPSV